MRDTKKFQTLDITIPHGRYVPTDNVAMIITKTFNCIPNNKINKLRFKKAWETLIEIVDLDEITFDKIVVDINDDFVKILGTNKNDKAFNIEVSTPPIS